MKRAMSTRLGAHAVCLAAMSVALAGTAEAGCFVEGCAARPPIRLAPAAEHGIPLIWSARLGRLVAPRRGVPVVLDRTVPIELVVGRQVLPFGYPPRAVSYNAPDSFAGAVDPGLTLMSLLPPRRPAARRGAYPED